ncbi:CD3324 family protein [Solibacillus silvestris]|uniref:CD3324 family protein n=1 Tax=Solibacillus silvestris TaxID=76853 RepID=UPI003F806563
MSYKKANELLPPELLKVIQEYIDGECIYIPRKKGNVRSWGSNTGAIQEMNSRNKKIYSDYLSGIDVTTLSTSYYLSVKSIQRIVRQEKKNNI